MALADHIRVLRDRVLADLIAAHDYYSDTKIAWGIVLRQRGGQFMPLPTVDQLVAELDRKRQTEIGQAESRLFREHGLEALISGFIAAFPHIRNWAGRNVILFWLIRFARKRPEVVDLAVQALHDPSYLVRMHACSALAYSLRGDTIPHLEQLLQHRDDKTRQDAAAAIDAIKHQNHHYWFDRDHSGKAFWTVNPDDERAGSHPSSASGA